MIDQPEDVRKSMVFLKICPRMSTLKWAATLLKFSNTTQENLLQDGVLSLQNRQLGQHECLFGERKGNGLEEFALPNFSNQNGSKGLILVV